MRPINQPTSLPDGPAPKVLLADKGYDEITPIYPMDLDDRIEAMKRVGRECGMGRHGANDNTAPPLQFLKSGVWTAKAQDLEVENDFNMSGGQYGYGESWGRPALGYRIRCFITVAALQALFANDQLQFHLNTAVNLGITGEAGIANWRNAANVARDVFLQRGVVKPAE